MPSLTIRHVTTYRYRHPVAFGEHRMMLRPRDSHDQKVIEASLGISPEPSSLRFVQDAFGNHVAIAQFDGSSRNCASRASSASSTRLPTLSISIWRKPPRLSPSITAPTRRRTSPTASRAIIPIRKTSSDGGPASSCTPAGRSARSSFLSVSAKASIRAFSTGGGKPRESRSRSRRCVSATAVAATSPC